MAEKRLLLKPLKFGNRLRKYVLIPYYLDVISNQGNLKEAILKVHMIGFDAALEKDFFKPGVSEVEKEAALKKTRDKIEEKNRRNIEEYLPILFNQALVMACAVLDIYLFDSLKVLTTKKPNILKGLAREEDIKISDLIDLADYKKIFSHIQNKVLNRFDFVGIEKKLEILGRLGINIKNALGLKTHNEKAQREYANGYELLLDAYKKRNDIVHRDQLPLRSYADLSKISTYFDYFMSDLGFTAGRRFGILTDFELFIRDPRSVDVGL